MSTRWLRALVCSIAFLCPALATAQTAPGWEEARKAILADYARQQPGDRVLELSGPDKRDAVLLAVRYYGTALIERADRTRNRDRVWVEYRLIGERWELHAVRVYESTDIADLEPPSKDAAQELLTAAWKAANCEAFDIKGVGLEGEPRYQRETVADRAKAKRWFVYRVQVEATGNGKFRLSKDGVPYVNRTQNLLLWNPDARTWSVEKQQLRCTGFSEKK